MFINPKIAINEGWIAHAQCQTMEDWNNHNFIDINAINFSLDLLSVIKLRSAFIISELGKQDRMTVDVNPCTDRRYEYNHNALDKLEFWHLDDAVYEGISNMYLTLPDGVAAILITIHDLSANGIFILPELYDSGFNGYLRFILHNSASNFNTTTKIAKGTRVGKILFILAEDSSKLYGSRYPEPKISLMGNLQ